MRERFGIGQIGPAFSSKERVFVGHGFSYGIDQSTGMYRKFMQRRIAYDHRWIL